MPNWEEIQNEWETSEITFKDLAEKHGVKDSTIRSRKNREKWQRNATDENATQRATKTKSVATEKDATKPKRKRKERKNRSGNPNPVKQFTKRNSVARKHGLRSKYFNETQLEIMEDFNGTSIADQIWIQIEIKFSAIIHMQKVMWVENSYDHISVLSGEGTSEFGSSETYKVALAFEQYEAYIKAQARAMAEYRNLVKQYIELTDEFDERRLKLEGMQVNIEKTKADTDFAQQRAEKLKGTKKDTGLLDALVAGREEYMQMKEREKDE